ncbi:hypothetical protein EOT10_15360 [Streptomyces antnestii]|uniref:Sortase n=1 Tax=Streptomyces antnestii TaxID=2494256 RepID=A0A437PQ29_9ACTN|nr:hypothetical protein [Streptomyces sp. San01]RVU24393.1 hypothetical protein EOT10_15360 [Streptomyces sp. San01]
MRTDLIALRAAGVAALLVTLPVAAAHAEGGGSGRPTGSVTVTPDATVPGSQVDLRVSGCKEARGKAFSDAFEAPVDLVPSADQPTLTNQARIRSSLTPGTFEIKVTCDGVDGKVRGSVRILEPNRPSPPATPTAPVHAGGGGTARLTAVHTGAVIALREDGPGTRHAVIGLVLAAVAAVAVALRSVRRRRSG